MLLVSILPLSVLIEVAWIEGLLKVDFEQFITYLRLAIIHLLAYLTVILLPYGLISKVGKWLTPKRIKEDEGEGDNEGTGEKGEFHAGALIGALERSLIFILFLMTTSQLLPLKDALGSLTLIIAAKALFRFSERTEEAEWYIVGTFLSITSGVALSCLTLHLIRGSPC